MLDYEPNIVHRNTGQIVPSDRVHQGDVIYPARFDLHYKFQTFGNERASVSLAEFSQVRRYKDFCRIEAIVYVTFTIHPSLPPISTSILTSVPTPRSFEHGQLRRKLIRSAVNLALLMPQYSQEELLRTA